MTRVIVGTGGTSGWPHFGGSVWVRLQYLLGLERLGVEAFWVDRLPTIDPAKNLHGLPYLVKRFGDVARDFGFEDRYCIVYEDGEELFGMDEPALSRLVDSTDLLLDISGELPATSPMRSIPRKAYVDVDPGYTQQWASQVDLGLDRHDVLFTTGQNVGRSGSGIDAAGRTWRPTVPPVVLDQWPPRIDASLTRISTVADWRGSQYVTVDGECCGGKREELLGLIDLPERCSRPIDLALLVGAEDHEDLRALLDHGWRLHDPYAYAGDPHSYREFIQQSRGEFSVAKRGYVRTRSGWVSDRTACYLASGKPAIVQSTGFEEVLPVGRGLLTFTGVQEAVEAIRDVDEHYETHAAAARALAEERFASDLVLGSLLERVGL
jgi:hypothetical protein